MGAARPPREPGFDHLGGGLVHLLVALSRRGPVAYLETSYAGGIGRQAGAAFVDGRCVCREAETDVRPLERARGGRGTLVGRVRTVLWPAYRSRRFDGPIDRALGSIGARRTVSWDEFDVLGLGRHRRMDEHEAPP